MEALQHCLSSFNINGAQVAPAARASAKTKPQSCILRPSCPSISSSLRGGSTLFSDASLAKKVEEQGGAPGHARVLAMAKAAASGYAAALADIGKATNSLDTFYADVEKLGGFLQDKQFATFIYSPVVKQEHKKAVLKDLAKEASFQTSTLNLLYLIVDKKRTAILKDFVKEFENIYNDLTDTQVAIVTSAVQIDKSQLSLIGKKVQSMSGCKNVKLKNVIDPSLIAGFIVRFGKDGSRLIDMSVKGQLDRISALIDVSDKATAISY